MRVVARAIGRAFIILLVTLALDYILLATVFSDLKRNWTDAATAYTHSYISSLLHHDLAPNASSERAWGNIVYHFQTDRYGFRTGQCAPGESEKSWPAIFVVGDSFAEGIGTSYEKSFVGLMACDAARHGRAVWNLGVTSYSPIIYYRKLLAAHDRLGITPDEVYVFVDISDIDDEAPTTCISNPLSARRGPSAATARSGPWIPTPSRPEAGAGWRWPTATWTRSRACAGSGNAASPSSSIPGRTTSRRATPTASR